MSTEPPGRHPEQLWSSSHHWHLVGAAMSYLTLDCCSCGYSLIVEPAPQPSQFLRYALMEGSRLTGVGRGLLMADCSSGQRRLAIDGYEDGCTLYDGDEFDRRYGLEAEGVIQVPTKEVP